MILDIPLEQASPPPAPLILPQFTTPLHETHPQWLLQPDDSATSTPSPLLELAEPAPRALTSFQGFCKSGSMAAPLLEMALQESGYTPGDLVARVYAHEQSGTNLPLWRQQWQFNGRLPDSDTSGKLIGSPQALYLPNGSTLYISAHYNNTESRMFKVNIDDGHLLGQFSFGTSTYRHVATMARRANGDYWIADYETGQLVKVDMPRSFATGQAQILSRYDLSDAGKGYSIEFVTVGGHEYLLAANYYDSDTPQNQLWVIPAEQLDQGRFQPGQEYRHFHLGIRIQGFAMANGKLIVSRNDVSAGGQPFGWIERYDIRQAIETLANGSNLTPEASWLAPSLYPEDVAVNPADGRIFVGTEGFAGLFDHDGWRSYWSSDLSGRPERNHASLDYTNNDAVHIKVNGQDFSTRDWRLTSIPGVICVGAAP